MRTSRELDTEAMRRAALFVDRRESTLHEAAQRTGAGTWVELGGERRH